MNLDEIDHNDFGKDVSINQDEYQEKKQRLRHNRLPFSIDIVRHDGRPVSLTVAVARSGQRGDIIVHVIDMDADRLIGRLYLVKPDIFPAAYYVERIGILPEYQSHGIGRKLYRLLMQHLGLSLVALSQSLGARKTWIRLSQESDMQLFAIWPNSPQGYLFYRCEGNPKYEYQYTNYADVKKFLPRAFLVILTERGSKMSNYIERHMEAALIRAAAGREQPLTDPFGVHIRN